MTVALKTPGVTSYPTPFWAGVQEESLKDGARQTPPRLPSVGTRIRTGDPSVTSLVSAIAEAVSRTQDAAAIRRLDAGRWRKRRSPDREGIVFIGLTMER